MKKLDQKTLSDLAKNNSTKWHHLVAAGHYDPSYMFLLIEDEDEARIMAGEILPSVAYQPTTRPAAEIDNVQAICSTCQWNINWICEHPGCKPCRQRRAGGLKGLILDPTAHCPAGKWQ